MLLPVLPQARDLLGNRGYDSAGFRAALLARGIQPCILSTRKQKIAILHDKMLYRQRHRIKNAFGPPQRLGPHRYVLRPMPPHLLLRHLSLA